MYNPVKLSKKSNSHQCKNVKSASVNDFKSRIKPMFDSVRSYSKSFRRLPDQLMTASDKGYQLRGWV